MRKFLCTCRFVIQSLSCVWLFANHVLQRSRLPCPSPSPTFCEPCTAALQPSLSFTISWTLLKLVSIELVMSSNQRVLSRPLLLPHSVFPSIRVFSNESVLHSKWPKYWSFSFSISSSNEYLVLISFRMDWLDLLAFQRTSRVFSNTTVQKHHSFDSAFFMVQHSYPYMTTGKNHSFDFSDLCWQSNVSGF